MLNPTLQAPAEAEAEVHAAARAFGAALKSSHEFTALLAADEAISTDAEANAAIAAFEQLQQEFRAEITVGVLTDAHRADLEQQPGKRCSASRRLPPTRRPCQRSRMSAATRRPS